MQSHFERHLGGCLDVLALRRGVRVLSSPSPLGDGVVLATDGACALAGARSRGIELVMPCRAEHAEAAAIVLCDLAHYGREHGVTLGWFQVLPLGSPVVKGSRLTAVLLTMPWFGTADFFAVRRGELRVDVVHAIPITDRERGRFASSGADALEQALEDAGADITDFARASVV